ncbi:uncharacterized protein LOC100162337 [Acyrthosiphon pisum]|uniref:N-acetyltransferase domain-containing protein n=1 Tax=Acyrthosiphon pisum TaxID=7029 RepID=A0A8R1W211_ACYPI|nr:uncharacterized protein LOC100162337 [Acyrthosiphon pisum]|eukprot:XP_001949754.1 PREDICTED: spermidine/spermine N(1)-acetyltransferase-like protein 1 [Acyrthosiphon pisum]
MSRMKTLCAMESLVEGVPQVNFVICPAVIDDCDQIYELVQEYYSEYGIPSSRQLNKDTFRRDGFESQNPSFQCFIAKTRREEDVIIGFVLWFRPSENTTGQPVFLEALYVSKPYRQKHLEQALFEKTIQIY